MSTSKMLSRGRVTIPIEIRKKAGLVAGSKIKWIILNDGTAKITKVLEPEDVYGMLQSKGKSKKALTIREMDEAVAKAFKKGKFVK